MPTNLTNNSDFKAWITELKLRIRQGQIKAAIKVNSELLRLYWDLGRDIVLRQMDAEWGSGFFEQLSKELMTEFPDMKEFSVTNLNYCKRFYKFYTGNKQHQQISLEFSPQLGGEIIKADNESSIIDPQVEGEFQDNPLFSIPWGHQKYILDKCKSIHEALFYVQKTIKNGWSRAVLMNFIDADLYQSQGKSVNNFERLLNLKP